jgi:hypothetical protein
VGRKRDHFADSVRNDGWVFYCTNAAGMKSQRYMRRLGKMPCAAQGKLALTKGRGVRGLALADLKIGQLHEESCRARRLALRYRAGTVGERGTQASMQVPPPGREWMNSSPPKVCKRSCILRSPRPCGKSLDSKLKPVP